MTPAARLLAQKPLPLLSARKYEPRVRKEYQSGLVYTYILKFKNLSMCTSEKRRSLTKQKQFLVRSVRSEEATSLAKVAAY